MNDSCKQRYNTVLPGAMCGAVLILFTILFFGGFGNMPIPKPPSIGNFQNNFWHNLTLAAPLPEETEETQAPEETQSPAETQPPVETQAAEKAAVEETEAAAETMPAAEAKPDEDSNAAERIKKDKETKAPRKNAEPEEMESVETTEPTEAPEATAATEETVPEKVVYTLNDSDLVAPKPNPDNYIELRSMDELPALLEQAGELLDGQTTFLKQDTPVWDRAPVRCYYDDTILAMSWKQSVANCAYTFLEVKIADPSQFRRFLSGGRYGSGLLNTTTDMSATVNAVAAASGDYYSYRYYGIVVNDGVVYRDLGYALDTCFIDDKGDLLFVPANGLKNKAEIEKYVEENNVRFSLSFGPVMIRDGKSCVPYDYYTGEINGLFPRSALCQLDELHYLVVTANAEDPYWTMPTLGKFADELVKMGVHTAYTLDGGQTATIAINNEYINQVNYGSQRNISDIIYFATALPEEEK